MPSLFAILVTFLVMRLTGIPFNIATILIATTVLGVTENDQIHFFYHFLERRNGGSTEAALAHTIRVAGHAILFATLINAGGFLALTLSELPPMRQFGVVTSMAFTLAMLADFTAGERVAEAGRRMAEFDEVSHCYERPTSAEERS